MTPTVLLVGKTTLLVWILNSAALAAIVVRNAHKVTMVYTVQLNGVVCK